MFFARRLDERRHDKYWRAQFPLHVQLHIKCHRRSAVSMLRNSLDNFRRFIQLGLLFNYRPGRDDNYYNADNYSNRNNI